MKREFHKWFSHRVNLEMPVIVYGHFGLPLLMIPTASEDCEEYERRSLIGAMKDLVEGGSVKIFSVDSINRHTWGSPHDNTGHKAYLTQKFDEYIIEEVVPFIFNHCRSKQPIITCGASMGAFYAANTFLKHPDIIDGMVGLHGVYNLDAYRGNYFDQNCYFNNPISFLPNMDEQQLATIKSKKNIHVLSSYGMWEDPEHSKEFSRVLAQKGIKHNLEMWDNNWPHDWPSWHTMLPKCVRKILATY